MAWSDRKWVDVDESSMEKHFSSLASVRIGLDWNQFHQFSSSENPFKFSKLFGTEIQSEIIGESEADIPKLRNWLTQQHDLVLGYFGYDAKNLLENLSSKNSESIGFPMFHFFVPKHAFLFSENGWTCFSHSDELDGEIDQQNAASVLGNELETVSKSEYVHKVKSLQQHIQFGDIYEANFCVQHGFENTAVDPLRLYRELQFASPAPFSCFVADNGKYLMSSSPERFMMKEGAKLISQPMKGTNRRTADNDVQKMALRNDAKEVAENVMITDLVRNDLSRSAKKGSVKVDELCGVYEFEHVNAMISTVSAELREDVHPLDALLNAFPMGSMTGAPKIRAMELIDQFEDFSRGLYSGAVGYFTPELDFDFNVVIRSILYNEEKQLVTFPTGSAITIQSDPEKEYEECMLKAEAMRNVLLNHAK